ncbi:hypothetical protein ACOT81_31985 [Streptomyces sp. WI04-05B]|uniref:hypothetical protein n=1 Tax=Streptomyces TaxID=1883 RepID=UPI0029B64EA3|nr:MULTISPECIES: hypothetical protein [unclassified Streptomyces]MDX2542088.1 hypothetical protein [Streptomyces sp. WI04-05B]MDX2583920.1 hypothetical protein [Streptomyces sp. WI04-05A]MDX3750368.1 hypothetical protein [Streptomyces sp. AK08-02]
MNTAADNIAGILFVVAVFVALALPSLIGLARDRRIDRQLREAQQARRETEGRVPTALPAPRRRYFTTTVTHHS